MNEFAVLLQGSPIPVDEVEKLFADCEWSRMNHWVWFIKTTKTNSELYGQLRTLLGDDKTFLILPVDLKQRYGWVDKTIVGWFAQYVDGVPPPD